MTTSRPVFSEVLLDHQASRLHGRNQAEFIASLHLCGNTGTYVDSPAHRFRAHRTWRASRPAHLPAIVVSACRDDRTISPAAFRGRSEGGYLHAVPIAWKGRASF